MNLLAILGLKSLPGNCRNGFPNVHKLTQIIKLNQGMCRINYQTHMHNQSNSDGCYHFLQSDIKKVVLDLWGNEM